MTLQHSLRRLTLASSEHSGVVDSRCMCLVSSINAVQWEQDLLILGHFICPPVLNGKRNASSCTEVADQTSQINHTTCSLPAWPTHDYQWYSKADRTKNNLSQLLFWSRAEWCYKGSLSNHWTLDGDKKYETPVERFLIVKN
jgi:hypothetical protein